MSASKLEIFQEGQTYFARLPGNMYISVNHNTGESRVAAKPKKEALPGKPLILYPQKGWMDAPKMVLQTITAAFHVAACARAKRNGNTKKGA
jgi:hypothetical protein